MRRPLQLSILRGLLDSAGLPSTAQMAQQPGVSDVVRVTVHYYDRRGRDCIATVRCFRGAASLELRYPTAFGGRPLIYLIDELRPQRLLNALRHAGFDSLVDQTPLPDYDAADAWLIERAAGTFAHSVIVVPALAAGAHAGIAAAVETHLPEAFRLIT